MQSPVGSMIFRKTCPLTALRVTSLFYFLFILKRKILFIKGFKFKQKKSLMNETFPYFFACCQFNIHPHSRGNHHRLDNPARSPQ